MKYVLIIGDGMADDPLEQLDEAIHKSMDSKHSCKVCIKVDPAFPDYPYNKQD